MRPEAMREHETSADGTLPDVPPAAFDRSLTLDERIMNLAVHMVNMTDFIRSLEVRQGFHRRDLHVLWQDWEFRMVRSLVPARQDQRQDQPPTTAEDLPLSPPFKAPPVLPPRDTSPRQDGCPTTTASASSDELEPIPDDLPPTIGGPNLGPPSRRIPQPKHQMF